MYPERTMMIKRIYQDLNRIIESGKVVIIYGPRQVGKTTIIESFVNKTGMRYRLDTGDNLKIRNLLSSLDFERILEYASEYELIIIDEAQEIENIGKALKIIVDYNKDIKVLIAGSSSFNIAQKVGEPLTGRKITKILYPVSQKELKEDNTKFELKERLEEFLLYGSYPEVVATKSKEKKKRILKELVNSYLLKDILIHENIKSPKILLQLLKLLAFQIGSEVSLNELSRRIGVDIKTISRYIDLLEKCFIIKKLSGFSGNMRKEVTQKSKYYFLDTGIRNALISQFNGFEDRNDIGVLFENFCIMERIKKHEYEYFYGNHYFWRTYGKQEIDLIEENDGNLYAFEFKISEKKRIKVPKTWEENYKNSEFTLINRENYLNLIL